MTASVHSYLPRTSLMFRCGVGTGELLTTRERLETLMIEDLSTGRYSIVFETILTQSNFID